MWPSEINPQHQLSAQLAQPPTLSYPMLTHHAENRRETTPDPIMPAPLLSSPMSTSSDFNGGSLVASQGDFDVPAPYISRIRFPPSWGIDLSGEGAVRAGPPAGPSRTVTRRPVRRSPPSAQEWSKRMPGLHAWMKNTFDYQGEAPLDSAWQLGCYICGQTMFNPSVHLEQHASRWWSPILFDEPMPFREFVAAISFIIVKDRRTRLVFSQDEDRAFPTFLWNYDSLEYLDGIVKYSDDMDDCLTVFKFRIWTWAMGAYLFNHPGALGGSPNSELLDEIYQGTIPSSPAP